MNILLLHLSDIHIRSSSDEILTRADHIARSLYSYLPNAAALFVVVSGDIAFSGLPDEYAAAEIFLRNIISIISEEKELPISVILVPGNHDCDFSKSDSVRSAVLEIIRKEGEAGIDNDRISLCLQVQDAFDKFRQKFETHTPLGKDPLWRQYLVDVNGNPILFNCLNVSWMSQLDETPGQLVFPVKQYQDLGTADAVLRIVILHHPLNWYHEATYHGFRTLVRTTGDIVLSGHEHIQGAAELNDALTKQSVNIEGAALQPHNSGESSGFNVIDIDLDDQQYKCELFKWVGNEYQPVNLQEAWLSYRKLLAAHNNEFSISTEFLNDLDNPGANFRHPAKPILTLSDFYIYPDLEEIIEDGEINHLVSASVLESPDASGTGVVVKGQEKSGKTALLHTLFRRYHEAGYVPILLRGNEISKVSDKELNEIVEEAVTSQYCNKALHKWRTLPRARRVVLLDDYNRSKVSDRYRSRIVSYCTKHFGHVLVTTDDIVDVSEATLPETAAVFSQFKHYEIQPFGHKLRFDLIQRWGCIGEDYTRSSTDLLAHVDKAEKVIDSVLGKNLVPRVPIYLLTLLQSLESSLPSDIQNSAFGHYYQYLITQDLQKINVRLDELDEFFHYCSQLAWFFHQTQAKEIDSKTLLGFNEVYSKKFLTIDFSKRFTQLYGAKLLNKRGDFYSFSYPYIYYFFLGKYLAENLHSDAEVRNLVERYCGHLYVREYANAILFLTHHSKEGFIIECVVNKLRLLFSDKDPISLEESDTATLNDLVESTSRLVFAGGNPESNRRRHRELQDTAEADEIEEKEQHKKELDGELDLSEKLHMLFKTVEILGQILKNHYGRLEGALKLDLMREVYQGPLRALRGFLEVVTKDREAIIEEVENFIESKNKQLDKDKLKKLAHRALFEFVGMVTYGFLFKASSAVGSEHLRDVARNLIQETPSTAFRLIELGTRLDSPTALPFEDIEKLEKEASQNIFAHRLLETIVLRHLYLFKTTDKDKQRICEILGVSVNYQQRIDFRTKNRKLL